MFEEIVVNDFFYKNTDKTDETRKIFDSVLRPILGGLSEKENKNLPKQVMEIFIALLFGKELIYAKLKEVPVDKKHCQKTCEKMVKALSDFYKDDKKSFSAENEQSLLDMFEINQSDFQAKLHENQKRRDFLYKNIPGKNRQEKEFLLLQRSKKALNDYKELQKDWDDVEKSIQKILSSHIAFRRMNIMDLLLKTDFFDRFIDKRNATMINFLTDFFKNNTEELYVFFEHPNDYLKKTNITYSQEPTGVIHVVENPMFATSLCKKIPPALWQKSLVLALGCHAFHHDTQMSFAEDFIKKLEQVPSDHLKNFLKQFLKITKKIFFKLDQTHDIFVLKNLRAFLTTPKTEELKQFSASLSEKLTDEQFIQITENLKENETGTICSVLNRTPKNRHRLLNLTLQNGRNLVWSAYEKGILKSEEMDILITEAISQDNTKFLFESKDLSLTPDFPAYKKLHHYFKDKTQAIRFVNTFQTSVKTEKTRFSQLKDFITQPQMILKIASLYSIVHYYAKESSDEKLLDFFFTGDIKNRQNLTLKISPEQAKEFLLKQDKDGKTPWHYLCMKRNRLFFGKNFKVLHPLFLQSCRIKDNDGKTPLDYISDDLKFKKVLAEKIPAVEKLMAEAGLSLTYTPKQKEAKEEVKEEPKTEILPQKIEEKKRVWKIEEMGHDKLRKDDFFYALLKREIAQLPPPNCGSVNVANNRLQKKEVLGTPVFKIWYENKRWRVPFIKDDRTQTLFIFPTSDRNDTYTNLDYCRIVRNRVKWLKRHAERIKS